MKDPKLEASIHEMQHRCFGHRYVGATLANCSMHGSKNDLINSYMQTKEHFLVLTGVPGCGKTYIAAALVEWMLQNFATIRIWKEYDLYTKIKLGIDKGWDCSDTLSRLIDDDIVVVDDLGSQSRNDWRENILTEMIDVRYSKEKATIFTTNLSEKDFCDKYDPKIASRIFAHENTVIDLSSAKDLRREGM